MVRLAVHQAAAMTESELQEAVRSLCRQLGLAVNHFPDSRRSWLPGWPDLEVLGSRILHRELKGSNGVLQPEQRRVGSLITRAGGDWAVWRPRDLADGTIRRQLEAIASTPG